MSMSSPEKKMKTTKEKEPSTQQSNPKKASLPDDLLLSIFARVPRLYYTTLSFVSKSFRSLLASPDLYKARSLLGHTESCLYVCFRVDHSYSVWFTLCRKPNQKETSSGYVLSRVPMPDDSPCAQFSSLVAVDSDIYNIGVSRLLPGPYEEHTSKVSILDCRSHTWREAPSLHVEPIYLSASVLDQKIYVIERYNKGAGSWKNYFEVLDTKTQIWDPKPILQNNFQLSRSTCIEGKFHVVSHMDGVFAFNSKESTWNMAGQHTYTYDIAYSDSFCEIDNVLYFLASDGSLRWYNNKERRGINLKGLVGLPKLPHNCYVKLAGYGGKMVVLWDKDVTCNYLFDTKKIWCTQIALERRESCEIWGTVEWIDHVLTVPRSCKLIKVLAATV